MKGDKNFIGGHMKALDAWNKKKMITLFMVENGSRARQPPTSYTLIEWEPPFLLS
jgi:hypothetical protein